MPVDGSELPVFDIRGQSGWKVGTYQQPYQLEKRAANCTIFLHQDEPESVVIFPISISF
jgi:hypothetical protein